MAMSLRYRSTEKAPSPIAAPQPSCEDHGILSNYQSGHLMKHWRPTPEADGLRAMAHEEDGEAVPRYLKPTPMTLHSHDLRTMLDPTLCLTPDKTSKSILKSGMNTANLTEPACSALPSASTSPKVRFEPEVTVKFLGPENQTQDEIIDIDRSDDPELELSFTEPLDGTTQGLGDQDNNPLTKSPQLPKEYHYQTYSDDTDQEVQGIISGTVGLKLRDNFSSSHVTQHVISDKETKVREAANFTSDMPRIPQTDHGDSIIDIMPQKMGPEKTSLMAMGDSGHILARPELNTTLYTSKEVCKVADQELKSAMAEAKARLEHSTRVRTAVEEKAYSHLNTKEPKFPGLVGIELEEEDLVASAAREMASKVKPTHKVKAPRPEDQIAKPPDIMEFFTPDLQREVASFTLHGIPGLTNSLCTADQNSAFDIYSHIRAWENW